MADKDYGVKVKRNGKAVAGAQVIVNIEGHGITDSKGVMKLKLGKDGPIAVPIVIRGEGFCMGMSGAVLEPNTLLEIEV